MISTFYHGTVLNQVKIVQPSVYHEQRGSISTTYHSDYYDRILPAEDRNKGLHLNMIDILNQKKVFLEDCTMMIKLGNLLVVYMEKFI